MSQTSRSNVRPFQRDRTVRAPPERTPLLARQFVLLLFALAAQVPFKAKSTRSTIDLIFHFGYQVS